MARNVTALGNIEVGSDIDFEKRWRRTQWIVWTVMILFVIAGLLGLFGRGPMSKKTVTEGATQVEYERFARYRTPAPMTVSLLPSNASSPQVEMQLDDTLLDGLRAEQTKPQPLSWRHAGSSAVLTFDRPRSGMLRVHFAQEPPRAGPTTGHVVVDGHSFTIKQFVYP
jgi:hypothetical protein